MKLESPEYVAETVCFPTASVAMVKAGPVPAAVPSIVHEMVPVGVPEPGVLTESVAVNMTESPKVDGASEEETINPVAARFTVCIPIVEVLM
jgi:hypothetical protein